MCETLRASLLFQQQRITYVTDNLQTCIGVFVQHDTIKISLGTF